jgi:type I restriction enzyme M protein
LLTERHKEITDKIWEIANRLRGPYRPPQYRLVMLPMVALRRLDCVLEPTKDAVLIAALEGEIAGLLKGLVA